MNGPLCSRAVDSRPIPGKNFNRFGAAGCGTDGHVANCCYTRRIRFRIISLYDANRFQLTLTAGFALSLESSLPVFVHTPPPRIPDRGPECCDDRYVAPLSRVALRAYLQNYTCPIFTNFLLVTYCRGSVPVWRCCDTLCTSGFTDDVIFVHNGQE